MFQTKWFALILMGILFIGCGPDTIFVRPGLDTPAQHVINGNQLLERGKIDDACREFERAKELDPNFVRAYVSLGVALGKKGDFDAGMKNMGIAKQKADSVQDYEYVKRGYEKLREIRRLSKESDLSD